MFGRRVRVLYTGQNALKTPTTPHTTPDTSYTAAHTEIAPSNTTHTASSSTNSTLTTKLQSQTPTQDIKNIHDTFKYNEMDGMDQDRHGRHRNISKSTHKVKIKQGEKTNPKSTNTHKQSFPQNQNYTSPSTRIPTRKHTNIRHTHSSHPNPHPIHRRINNNTQRALTILWIA